MNDYVVSILSAFIGTIGFSIFFNIKKERLLYVSILGTAICGIYLFCLEWLDGNLFLSNLIPSMIATVYSELSARWKKAPAIVFLLPSIIVLIPGGSFYYTMSYLVNGNHEMFRKVGIQTIHSALGIAVGILIASVFFYQTAALVKFISLKLRKKSSQCEP